jgi:cytochrome d ubiquinol oxidase subunit I
MDLLILSRLQFAITTIYHFFFVPLTLGLGVIVAIMETIYVLTHKEEYKQMTKFWGKLFLINFAMGVVTGIVQEFQFGMNWSEFSRYVGDVFGAPLAIEALLAFFVESVFLGVWIFGWDKLSRGLHAIMIWLVAIAANVSAFWILTANSFMQQPVGYIIKDGRLELENFSALIFNPNLWTQFPHTVSAGFTTAAFFVMGISAYHLIRKHRPDIFQRSFQIAAMIATISIVLVGLIGHNQSQHMVRTQPMKMAAAEALWESENPASFSLLTIGDLTQRREVFSIRIPKLLSLLAYNRLSGEVKGINNIQQEYSNLYGVGDYIPPIAVVYWSFRIMVGIGLLLFVLAAVGLYLVITGGFEQKPLIFKIFIAALLLPYLANSAGWLLTEVGRFPWIVQDLMVLQDGLSISVSAWAVASSLILYTLIYAALMVADIYLLTKFAKVGVPDIIEEESEITSEDKLTLIGAQE